jgi:hypothetical protein
VMSKVHRWTTDPNMLPRIALTGLAVAITALAIASVAFIRIGIIAGQKADRADESSKAAQRAAAISVCALANAQRSGNKDAPPPTTDRGVYVAVAWQVTYESLGCKRFTQSELDAVVKTPAARPGN